VHRASNFGGELVIKKIILFVIDSLHPVVFERVLSEGNARALKFLANNGKLRSDVVSSFPTMTPVATSSIMTGVGPDKHLVPGFIWYNEELRRIVDYGGTWQSILKLGPERVLRNILLKLNGEHLNPRTLTLYEKLEASGLTTGSINFFIHRATQTYQAKMPILMEWATRFRMTRETIKGPGFLTLGQLIHPKFTGGTFAFPRGIFNRFGFNDSFSGQTAVKIIQEGQQPDFLVIYLPDNDRYSHKHGPLRTGPSLERADQQVGTVLDALGPWEKILEENIIIVTGDHSQTTVGLGNEYLIDLDRSLRKFKRLRSVECNVEDQEIAICPNERMAFIYIFQRKKDILAEVVGILALDFRNAQIAWKVRNNKYCVIQGGSEKKLFFSRRGPYWDIYGQSWNFEGDLDVVDAKIDADDLKLKFGHYPDAFTRLSSALEGRNSTRVVVSAASGYEYLAEGGPIHPGGGSHGSLEQEDSVVPMIIAGSTQTLHNPRIIDLFAFILEHFKLSESYSET